MATFGQYEAVREIAVSSSGSVWTAKLGEAAPAFAAKTYQPRADVVGEDQVARGVRTFLECARAQAQAAAAGRHWAPILDSGEVPGGAYYVTHYYPRSAKRLMDGKVGVDAPGLYQIASGVADGLEEIRSACGRPHGNLKASNILLDGLPGARATGVLLTDPADPSLVEAPGAEANDLYSLGQVLFELITHRQARRMMQWPIPPGPEWAQLGSKGDGWRDLCNQLLHPVPEESLRRLDDLRDRLAALAVGGKGGGKPVLLVGGAAAAVVLLSAGAAAWYLGFGRGKPQIVGPVDRPATQPFSPDTRPTGNGNGNGQGVTVVPNGYVDAEAVRKAFEQWKAKMAPPAVKSPVLRKAWEEARRKQLTGLTTPDPGVEARLGQLRDDLQALERDLSTVNAAGAPKADEEREALYAKAAKAVAEDASASDPSARVWRDLRDEYATWLGRQGDVRRAGELAEAAAAEHEQGHDRAALNKVEEALALDSLNAPAAELRRQIQEAEKAALDDASALAEGGKDLPGALNRLGALLNRDPEYAPAKTLRDNVTSRMDSAKANEALLQTAREQGAQGNDGAALDTLNQLLSRNPANADALKERDRINQEEDRMYADAGSLENAGELQPAIAKLKDLLKRNPGRSDAKRDLQDLGKKLARGLIEEARAKSEEPDPGAWQAALAKLDEAEKYCPRIEEAGRLRAAVNTLIQNHDKVGLLLTDGDNLVKQEEWKRAVDSYAQAGQLEPGNALVKERLAKATAGLKAYEEKVRQQEAVRTALARARQQLTGGDLDGAEASLAGLPHDLPDVQGLYQDVKGKREEREKAALAKVRQQINGGDLDGAEASLATFVKRPEPRPEAKQLLQDLQARREAREKEQQAAAVARAEQLRQAAAAQLAAGDPVRARDVLGAAENDRVRKLVKPWVDDVNAKIANAPIECARGNDLFFKKADYAGAFAAYQSAAQGGNVEGMLHLGGMYLNGMGAAKNAAEGLRWFETAANKGSVDAMLQLARQYEKGPLVTPNLQTAEKWYQMAARAGNPDATAWLNLRTAAANAHASDTGSGAGTGKPTGHKPVGFDITP